MRTILLWLVFMWPMLGYSGDMGFNPYAHRLYAGVNVGYGSTTWQGLVPNIENQNIALSISTPTHVTEGGVTIGGALGFEFSRFFALEANYLAYPSARIFFDENSLFAFETDGRTQLYTQTEAVFLIGKFLVPIPNTVVRAYSGFGFGGIHRNDEINNIWIVTPAFAAGLNVSVTDHIMGEIAANYMAGYGESELNPVQDFIPFLYAIYFKLAYRF